MEWFTVYKERLGQVYAQAEERISQFPEPLNTLGIAYADKYNPVKHDSGKDYICSLLPYWVKETSGISDSQCERLALANVYGMLYFFIQDDVMDSLPSAEWKEQLALGNLLLLEMFSVFRELFPSHSRFWDYYHRYVNVWAESVTNENRDNYFISDPIRTAGKAGPVKIASTGALLLTGRNERIDKLERAIEIVLMTLQMADDYADWKEDMAGSSYNGLLAMIQADRDAHAEPFTEKDAENAIYIRGCMQQYVQHATNNHAKLLDLEAGVSGLVDFHLYILDQLNQIAETIESNKQRLLKGGLNYLFTAPAAEQIL
ncbi:hypothetical protein [Paenibacillus sinopodophylli]|uniref:hypothetical protein n=1 Tax=Paenibacillus sinopodophylli TaxID=1837342 RepID=UPI00110CABF5|nr:hypothetical protein [Paenibacillus sinopodophylli]